MKNIKTLRTILLTLVFVSIAAFSNAQSVVGSWKKTNEVMLKENGKTTDGFKLLVKNLPCFANIVYTFSADGKMSEQAKDCTIQLQKQIANQQKSVRWKMKGDKLVLDVSDASSPVKHGEYQIEFVGQDEMIWTFKYSENPGVPNIGKLRQMQTTYVRL
jgi:hypothetical protein